MKKIFFLAILSMPSLYIFAEKKIELDEQWNKMIGKANTYQSYKVIKISELNTMWESVQEHVKKQDMGLANENNTTMQQKIKIAKLETQVVMLNNRIAQSNNEKDNIKFLKFTFNKHAYTTVLWLFIGLTLLSVAVLFYLYYSSNKITVQKIKDHTELSKAFEEYKQSKIEVERKLKRELQTYLNKSEEMSKEKTGLGRRN